MSESQRYTVCVDLDGVLNLYDGWRGEEHFPSPRPGAREFMTALRNRFRTVVLTTRDAAGARAWLDASGIEYDDVTSTKVPAVAYIDDRAIPFDGEFEGLLSRVTAFRPHWARTPGQSA